MYRSLLTLTLTLLSLSAIPANESIPAEDRQLVIKLLEAHPFWQRITSKRDGVTRCHLVSVVKLTTDPPIPVMNTAYKVTHVIYRQSGVFSSIESVVANIDPTIQTFKVTQVFEKGRYELLPLALEETQEALKVALTSPDFKRFYQQSPAPALEMRPESTGRAEDPWYGHRFVEVNLTAGLTSARVTIDLSTKRMFGRYIELRA